MSTQTETPPPSQRRQVSGWAMGGIAFAATMMVLIGTFQARTTRSGRCS